MSLQLTVWILYILSGYYFQNTGYVDTGFCYCMVVNMNMSCLKSQVVLLQTAHSWANAGVVLGARMHRERGSFRSN